MNVVFIHLILSQFKVSAITELLNYREAKLINIYLKKETLLKSTYFFVSNITKKETMVQGFPKKENPTERKDHGKKTKLRVSSYFYSRNISPISSVCRGAIALRGKH